MLLTIDQDNRIVGVEQQDSDYDYQGYVPNDLEQHKIDGYYMLTDNTIKVTPVVDQCGPFNPSTTTKQMNNLTVMLAMASVKGSEE